MLDGLRGEETIAELCRREARELKEVVAEQTLDKLGIPRIAFYRWYDRNQIVDLALDETELSPCELAVRFTDIKSYFVSKASVYRLLKAHDLISSPAFIVIKVADEFVDKTTAVNQLWQTDFTYLKALAGVGCICRQSLMITHVTSSHGNCAPP